MWYWFSNTPWDFQWVTLFTVGEAVLGEWYPDWIVEQPIYHDAGSNEIRNGCVIELHVIPSLGNIYLIYVRNKV